MTKTLSAIEAKCEAQKIAFAPIYFQCVVALRELGILAYIQKSRKKVPIKNIHQDLNLTEYGVGVLFSVGVFSLVVSCIVAIVNYWRALVIDSAKQIVT